MFLINRIFFWWIKREGEAIEFNQFYSKLKTLQEGSFNEKISIYLSLLDLYDNDVIYKTEMMKGICISAIQDENLTYKNEDIIFQLFETGDFVNIQVCLKRIQSNPQLERVFAVLLQCNT